MESFDRITVDASIMGGKACIRGLRITANTVAGLLSVGRPAEEILQMYPGLEREDLDQAAAYIARKDAEWLSATSAEDRGDYSLPDPPERHGDEGNVVKHLSVSGNVHFLANHYGNSPTILFGAQLYIVPTPGLPTPNRCAPDLLIAFDVDPDLYYRNNGYIVSEQGKPPDFVLEIASASTAELDLGPKRDEYAYLGIAEYWRFDETGQHYGERLACDRLVDGVYRPVEIEVVAEDILQGRSDVLELDIRWHDERLEWFDPNTGRHIMTFDDARAARIEAETRLDEARSARIAAEARELEAEVEEERRLRDGQRSPDVRA